MRNDPFLFALKFYNRKCLSEGETCHLGLILPNCVCFVQGILCETDGKLCNGRSIQICIGHTFELSTRIVAKNDHNKCETMKKNTEKECIPTCREGSNVNYEMFKPLKATELLNNRRQ